MKPKDHMIKCADELSEAIKIMVRMNFDNEKSMLGNAVAVHLHIRLAKEAVENVLKST